MTLDWYTVERPHKKVELLCDKSDYQNVEVSNVAKALMGCGLSEWEYYLAELFTNAIGEQKDNSVADVTPMFACDLIGIDSKHGEYTKSQEDVKEFLLNKLFDLVDETEEVLTLSVKTDVFN